MAEKKTKRLKDASSGYSYRTRINNGKTEYKVRYYFIKEGKKHDSETGWFKTLPAAVKEADALIIKNETEESLKVATRRDRYLIVVFNDFYEFMKLEEVRLKTVTWVNMRKLTQTLLNNYFPNELKTIKVNEVEPIHFRNWLTYINNSVNLAGSTLYNYKSILVKFNQWLGNNGYYIDVNKQDDIDTAIRKVKLRSKSDGNRFDEGDRNILDLTQFIKLTYYYYDKGIEQFNNFYYYTFFYVLYFGGMRVEELCGLQWKHIDLRPSRRTIRIVNAIPENEKEEFVRERLKKGIYRLKNGVSAREIPIFDFYYSLLLDYRESYRYQYDLSYEEMKEAFVFPKIHYNEKLPFQWFSAKLARCQLKNALKAQGLPNADLQCFRHSCAYMLILPPPDGLGFAEEKVIDYFGHSDTKMLRKIYAKLSKNKRLNECVQPSVTYIHLYQQKKRMKKNGKRKNLFSASREITQKRKRQE